MRGIAAISAHIYHNISTNCRSRIDLAEQCRPNLVIKSPNVNIKFEIGGAMAKRHKHIIRNLEKHSFLRCQVERINSWESRGTFKRNCV